MGNVSPTRRQNETRIKKIYSDCGNPNADLRDRQTGRPGWRRGNFRHSQSIVFAAATMGGIREGIDFFPLSVEYEERLYAGGRIPGSFFRREGRPGTEAILTCRA